MLRQGPGTLQLVVSTLSAGEQQRGFATLKDISIRLKSVKNIQKITKSMKMVAAAKYAKAERDLKVGTNYQLHFQKGNACFSLNRTLAVQRTSAFHSKILFWRCYFPVRVHFFDEFMLKISNRIEKYSCLQGARAYGVGARAFFDNIDPKKEGDDKAADDKQKQLLVLITSDR